MARNSIRKHRAISVIKNLGLVTLGLFLLYVIVGLWVVPPLIKPRLEHELARQIGREVTIENIRFNPLSLSATVDNLTVYENNGEPFAGFKELLVNAQIPSIVKRALRFKEIRLLAPFGVLKLLPDKKSNIDDIITKTSQTDQTPDRESGPPPPVILEKFQVSGGQLTFEDLTGPEPLRETFSPVAFTLENLTTLGDRQGSYRFVGAGPYEGKYQVEGRLSVNPVRIEGSFSTTGTQLSRLWKHLEDQVSFQIVKGSAEVSGNYAVAVTNGRLDARLQNGSLDIKDFQLTEKGKEMVLISVPSLTVEGIDADVENREIVVDQVRSVDGKIQSWLAPDGTLKLRSVLLPHGKKSADKEEPEPSETDEPPSRPWYATVNTVELNNWGAAIEDRTLPKPARFSFDDVTLTVDRLSNKKGAQAEAALALRINRAGAVHVRGAASMDPLAADLSVDLDKIALKSFQAYIDTAVDAQIDSGTVGTKGRLLYRGEQSQPQIRYEGELSLDDFGLNDRRKPEDFIKLAQLKISGVGLELLPNRLQVAQVLISEPYARVTIDQNGTVNVVQTFSPAKKGAENTKGEQNLLQRVADALIFQFKGPMPLKIDLVKLENFSGDLIDGSITPNFTTRLDINTATVKGLSSEPTAQADFRIDGTIAPSASLQIAGQMNPLSALQYTQVDLDLKDFDLKTVSPYSAKYVGYQIDQGKLGLKLAYLVDKDAIDGKNRIDIDQLTLGKKVDSPDAPDLPIALGVSLLKGADGRITLELPVKGNLGDPKYNIGEALTGSLTETITDAGSSPFTTISEVDGFKGEDLRFIEFEPGRSELTSLSRRKLDALSQYLAGRDALKLEIEGTADRQMDGNSIAGQETEKHPLQTRQTRAKTQQAESAKSQTVDDPALEQLARARADQVKTYLTGNGKVPSERVSLKQPRIKGAPDGNKSGAELFLLPR